MDTAAVVVGGGGTAAGGGGAAAPAAVAPTTAHKRARLADDGPAGTTATVTAASLSSKRRKTGTHAARRITGTDEPAPDTDDDEAAAERDSPPPRAKAAAATPSWRDIDPAVAAAAAAAAASASASGGATHATDDDTQAGTTSAAQSADDSASGGGSTSSAASSSSSSAYAKRGGGAAEASGHTAASAGRPNFLDHVKPLAQYVAYLQSGRQQQFLDPKLNQVDVDVDVPHRMPWNDLRYNTIRFTAGAEGQRDSEKDFRRWTDRLHAANEAKMAQVTKLAAGGADEADKAEGSTHADMLSTYLAMGQRSGSDFLKLRDRLADDPTNDDRRVEFLRSLNSLHGNVPDFGPSSLNARVSDRGHLNVMQNGTLSPVSRAVASMSPGRLRHGVATTPEGKHGITPDGRYYDIPDLESATGAGGGGGAAASASSSSATAAARTGTLQDVAKHNAVADQRYRGLKDEADKAKLAQDTQREAQKAFEKKHAKEVSRVKKMLYRGIWGLDDDRNNQIREDMIRAKLAKDPGYYGVDKNKGALKKELDDAVTAAGTDAATDTAAAAAAQPAAAPSRRGVSTEHHATSVTTEELSTMATPHLQALEKGAPYGSTTSGVKTLLASKKTPPEAATFLAFLQKMNASHGSDDQDKSK